MDKWKRKGAKESPFGSSSESSTSETITIPSSTSTNTSTSTNSSAPVSTSKETNGTNDAPSNEVNDSTFTNIANYLDNALGDDLSTPMKYGILFGFGGLSILGK